MTQHTQKCIEAQREREAWFACNPNACPHCNGTGLIPYYDSDTGENGADPCPHCFENGLCPICGHDNGQEWCCEADEPCPICNSIPGMEGAPIHECDCWLADAEEWERSFDERSEPISAPVDIDYASSDFLFDAARERRAFGR